MAKPMWLKKSSAILSIILYSGDVSSDFWVGIDLIIQCHYRIAANVFTWLLIPGFFQGWLEFLLWTRGECSVKNILKAVFFPIFGVPYNLVRLVKAAMDVENEDKITQAKR